LQDWLELCFRNGIGRKGGYQNFIFLIGCDGDPNPRKYGGEGDFRNRSQWIWFMQQNNYL
jgi:hypothetical protein